MRSVLLLLVLLALSSVVAPVARAAVAAPLPLRDVIGDYDAELRRADGRVDIDQLVSRLKELRVNTYFWLVLHAPTDWDDLKLFLPKAAAAGINVWVYLVPPSESEPASSTSSEPFRMDYLRWAEEIARLSLAHLNLKAWVIDDFYQNTDLYTPAYIRDMQERAKRTNPHLAFLPLMYYGEITRRFVEDYASLIDGVVVAYPQSREEIDQARAVLEGEAALFANTLAYPGNTSSQPGESVMISQRAAVRPADRYVLHFEEGDDYTGATFGYHFKQLLVDGEVVWEEDVAGGAPGWREVSVDVTPQLKGKAKATVAFRLLEKKGVGNFPVRWQLRHVRAPGLRLVAALDRPRQWTVTRNGAFETGFGEQPKRVGPKPRHLPFIVMTAGNQEEFRMRHGDPPSPERVAQWLRMSLQAWRAGKCEGVVLYCLDKGPDSATFAPARDVLAHFVR
jgi:hypothetical protein